MRWLAVLTLVACAHKFVPEEAAHVERHAPAIAAKAPAAKLVTASNSVIALADVIRASDRTIVVWYRGFF
jgi:hypothetical protein